MAPPPQPPRQRNLVVQDTLRGYKAPILAVVLGGLLYVYGYTSIQAAKRNAQRHREADGGNINWGNESHRRHGKLDVPEGADKSVVGGIVDEMRSQWRGEKIKPPPHKEGPQVR